MKESSTYQLIFEEGRKQGREEAREEARRRAYEEGRREEAVRLVLRIGTPLLGEPDADARQRIESEPSVSRLEKWLWHLFPIETWSELLAAP